MELDGVKFYFIDNEFYFRREDERKSIYGYGDDVERYIFFIDVVLEVISRIDFYLDVIYINDWYIGMLLLILKERYVIFEGYKNIKIMYIIYNF